MPDIDAGLAAEMRQMSDHTLALFIRACELIIEAYGLLRRVEVGPDLLGELDAAGIAHATALHEQQRRKGFV